MSGSQESLAAELDRQYGLRNLRDDWVRRQTAFSSDELSGAICRTDIGLMTHGTLPWNVHTAHAVTLGVCVLAQIEDVVNVARSEPRDGEKPRVLHLGLHDGGTDFVAVEWGPWGGAMGRQVRIGMGAGWKIMLEKSAIVRRGRVLLREGDFRVLGGPPHDLWGEGAGERVRDAMRAAGLPDGRERTLASVLEGEVAVEGGAHGGGQPDAGDGRLQWMGESIDALPLNIGGIAHPALIEEEDEDGEGRRGASVAVEAASGRGGGGNGGSMANRRMGGAVGAMGLHPAPQVAVVDVDASEVDAVDVDAAEVNAVDGAVVVEDSDVEMGDGDIPDVPLCDSDVEASNGD